MPYPATSTPTTGPNRNSGFTSRTHNDKPYGRSIPSSSSASHLSSYTSPTKTPTAGVQNTPGKAGGFLGKAVGRLAGWFGTPSKAAQEVEDVESPAIGNGNGTPKRGRESSPEGNLNGSAAKRARRTSPSKAQYVPQGGDPNGPGYRGMGLAFVKPAPPMGSPMGAGGLGGLKRSQTAYGSLSVGHPSSSSGYNDPPSSMFNMNAVQTKSIARSNTGTALNRYGASPVSSSGLGGGMKRSGTIGGSGSAVGLASLAMEAKQMGKEKSPVKGRRSIGGGGAAAAAKSPGGREVNAGPWSPWDKQKEREQSEALQRARQSSVALGRESPARGQRAGSMALKQPYAPKSASPFISTSPSRSNFRRSQSVMSGMSTNHHNHTTPTAGPSGLRRGQTAELMDMDDDDDEDERMKSPVRRGQSRLSAAPSNGRMSVDPQDNGYAGRMTRSRSRAIMDDRMDVEEFDDDVKNEADLIMESMAKLRNPNRTGLRVSKSAFGLSQVGPGGSSSGGIPKSFSSRTLRKEIFVPPPPPPSQTLGGSSIKFESVMGRSTAGGHERDASMGLGGGMSRSSSTLNVGAPSPYARNKPLKSPVGRQMSMTPSEDQQSRAASPRAEQSRGGSPAPAQTFSSLGQPSSAAPMQALPISFSPSARNLQPAANKSSALRSRSNKINTSRVAAPKASRPGSRFAAMDEDDGDLPSMDELEQAHHQSTGQAAPAPAPAAPASPSSPRQELAPLSEGHARRNSAPYLAPGQLHKPRASSPLKAKPLTASFSSIGTGSDDSAPSTPTLFTFGAAPAAAAGGASAPVPSAEAAKKPVDFGMGKPSINFTAASPGRGTTTGFNLNGPVPAPAPVNFFAQENVAAAQNQPAPKPVEPKKDNPMFKPAALSAPPPPASQMPTLSWGATPAPAAPAAPAANPFGGFNFSSKPAEPEAPKPAQMNGTASPAPAFGALVNAAAAASPAPTPAPAPAPAASSPFSFSAPAVATPPPSASVAANPFSSAPAFQFGAAAGTGSPAPASAPGTPTEAPKPFVFGAPSSGVTTTPTTAAPSGGFSFGGPPAAAPAPPSAPASTGGFNFGSGSPAPASNPFGAPASAPSTGNPMFGSSMASAPAAASAPASGGFNFGSSGATSTPTAPAPSSFNFGASSTNSNASNSSPFQFGASNPAPGNPSAPGFGFGGGSPAPAPSFGAAPSLAAAPAAFQFGGGFGGGGGAPASAAPASAPMSFSFSGGGGAPISPSLNGVDGRDRTGSPGAFNIGNSDVPTPGSPGGRTIRGMPKRRR